MSARDAQLLHAAEAVGLLDSSDRSGFWVAGVTGSLIRLRTRAASGNAADYLRRAGIDATAAVTNGGWVVKVWS